MRCFLCFNFKGQISKLNYGKMTYIWNDTISRYNKNKNKEVAFQILQKRESDVIIRHSRQDFEPRQCYCMFFRGLVPNLEWGHLDFRLSGYEHLTVLSGTQFVVQ